MKLYKYRSLENVEFTLDIINNQRLHCAPYEDLNDPFEGLFMYSIGMLRPSLIGGGPIGLLPQVAPKCVVHPQSIATSIIPMPGGKRICSLSASPKDVRLWSHYANGHKGVAIEVDLDEENEQLYEVEYVEQLKRFTNTVLTPLDSSRVLSVKSQHWSYEEEFRLISEDEYYPVNGMITGVYLGLRASDLMQEMLLRIIDGSTPVYSTKLNSQSIEIEVDKQVG